MKKNLYLLLATLLSCANIYAQTVTDNPLQKVFRPQMFEMANFSVQVGVNNTLYSGFYNRATSGIDVRIAYDLSRRCVFGLQANLLGKMNYTYLDAVKRSYTPDSGDFTPASYPMQYGLTFNTMNFYLFNRIYLAHNSHKRWGLFMANNIGVALLKTDISPVVEYDETKFELRPQGIQTGSQTIPTMGTGLGAHWKVGAFMFLPEALMCIPLNSVKYPYTYNPLPFHFQFNLGVAAPLGKREMN